MKNKYLFFFFIKQEDKKIRKKRQIFINFLFLFAIKTLNIFQDTQNGKQTEQKTKKYKYVCTSFLVVFLNVFSLFVLISERQR